MKKSFILSTVITLFLTASLRAGGPVKGEPLEQTSGHIGIEVPVDYISGLPPELKILVLSQNLSPEDLAHVSCVSHSWYVAAHDKCVWQPCAEHFSLRNAFISALYAPSFPPSAKKQRIMFTSLRKPIASFLRALCSSMSDDDSTKKRLAIFITHCDKCQQISMDFEGKYAFSLNKTLLSYGNQYARARVVFGLERGEYGYKENLVQAKVVIEQGVERGEQWALEKKVKSLSHGWHGYDQDVVQAKVVIEQGVERGEQWALERKIKLLKNGWHGYDQDVVQAQSLINRLIGERCQWVLEREVKYFENGWYGYDQDVVQAKAMIEQGVERGEQWALEEKVKSLSHGGHGSEINPVKAKDVIENFIEKGYQGVIYKKVGGLFFGHYPYKKNIKAGHSFINELIAAGNEDAIVLKAIFMAFGLFEHKKNLDGAVELVEKYGVHPYENWVFKDFSSAAAVAP